MKRSILFVTYPLVCGGVEKSLLSLLSVLPSDRFDVTLMLTEKSGDLLPYVPSWVKIVEVPFTSLDRYELNHGRIPALKFCLARFHWFHAIHMLWMRFVWRLGGRKEDYSLQVIRDMMRRVDMAMMQTQYDFAFAYAGGLLTGSIVKDLIRANVTGIWCHNENEIGVVTKTYDVFYAHFTHRFATGQMAERLNDGLKGRSTCFEKMSHYMDPVVYRNMAETGTGFTDDFDGLRILTVGRLCHQKGIDEAIRMAARLKATGLSFRWYVVGEGEDHEKLQRQIDDSNIGDRFVLLGQALNPFPFFSQCDIYAQPSRWEAFCMTVAEAKAFCKPIVVTDFVGAREQIKNGETGLIVPLGDYDAFYHAIARLLRDVSLQRGFRNLLSKESIDSSQNALECWQVLLG